MKTLRVRPRRLRHSPAIREMLESVKLNPADFIYPLFVVEGNNIKQEISSLPGQYRWSIDRLPEIIEQVVNAKVKSVMIFGIPEYKDTIGSENFRDDAITQQAIRKIKEIDDSLVIFTDVCLCSFTDHGHCGIVNDHIIENDATLEILQKTAVSHAKAGAHYVAPSGMMDGMIASMRDALDETGFENVGILSYAVKYASAFYGPFREACSSSLKGDRKSYQMNYLNDSREALKEANLDEAEGADMLMVKPGLAYLDIIKEVSQQSYLPIAAYNVSGEYAMVKAAAQNGWVDEQSIVLESLSSMKRAGADIILTYHALDASKWLSEKA
ncbi:porphobilinogen synthase [Francisellaceae bacterium]|nr:porphobilinogen synthase [Francisellaceae bacterium]